MKKNIIIAFLLLVNFILLFLYIKNIESFSWVTSKIDNILYVRIKPTIDDIIDKNVFDSNKIKSIYKNELSNNLINDILFKDNYLRITYNENYTPNAFFCTYIYSKGAFKKLDYLKKYKNGKLFDDYWTIFSKWILTKIDDDYSKYCLYYLF